MNSKVLSTLAGATLALAVGVAMPGVAQERQLSDSAKAGLAQLGFDPDEMMITVDQAAQIENVLSGTDSDDTKIGRIDVILGHPDDALVPTPLGTQQLRDSVTADIGKIGADPSGVDALTLAELAQIENVLSSSADDDAKRGQIESIMGRANERSPSAWGVAQLQESVTSGMAQLGLDPSQVSGLTLEQLAEIENVVNSTQGMDEKRGQVERIIAN